MAPNAQETFERQTKEIIHFLFEDEHDVQSRCLDACMGVETDAPDDFDPVVIADKLRQVADTLNDDVTFKAALTDLKKAVAQEAAEAAFRSGVEAMCKTQVSQRAEVAPEMQLIRASVAFGLYAKKSCPELKSKVQNAMTLFLSRNVGSWVNQQGGWSRVADI